MSPEEFRKFAHEAVDWMADYLGHPEHYSVLSRMKPGELVDALPRCGPEHGEPMSTILEDFRRQIVPAVAYFATSASGPGILGEMLAATLNMNGMLWKTSPTVVELEQAASLHQLSNSPEPCLKPLA